MTVAERGEMPRPFGYVLAGGRSERFGSDKARAVVQGQPLLIHAVEALRAVAADVRIVGDRTDRYADLGLPGVADREPHLGPMGGLLAALADARARAPEGAWILVSPCDLVGVRQEWLRSLMAGRTREVDAVAFRDAAAVARRSPWQPLPALYHTRLLPAVEAAIARQDRALWRLLEAGRARSLPLPADWGELRVVHTPADLPTS